MIEQRSGAPMLRIVHVIGRMPGDGTQRQLAGLLRCAHLRYWDATLVVLRAGDRLTREVADAGIPVVEFSGPDADPRRLVWLTRNLRTADVAHSSLWGSNAYVRLAVASLRRRPAVVISERSVEEFRSRARRRIDRALRRWTDAYIVNSNDVSKFVAGAHDIPAHRITTIRNAVDAHIFFPGNESADRHGPRRLGTVGRLIHEKGLDVLIAALPHILARQPVVLTIVGDGPERSSLERMARGLPVHFAGRLESPPAVAAFLRHIDVFVMPSRWEGLPNAVLEARACGVRVVATDVPGMGEAAGDGALLVPPNEPLALADAVCRSLTSPLPPLVSPHSFDDVAASHLAVFERVHARRTERQ
jgi:glycosyltransferase involved in cell wall biosynthesis